MKGHVAAKAAAYIAGLLDAANAADVERHMVTCAECARAVSDMRETAACAAHELPEKTPAPVVRERLLARVGRMIGPAGTLVRAHESPWTPSAIPGLESKKLFVDESTGNITSLVRMQPGTVYPPHRHFGPEQCYVIQGDVVLNDHALHAGDYEVALASTVHQSVTTRNGCLFLIVSNERDEFMPAISTRSSIPTNTALN